MHAAEGSTTATEVGAPGPGDESLPLALAWLFPLASVTPFELTAARGSLVIGRDEACDVRLAGDGVLRRHALLRHERADHSLVIEDQSSRNGVRVNGKLVRAAGLVAGDVVRLGGWVAIVTAKPGE